MYTTKTAIHISIELIMYVTIIELSDGLALFLNRPSGTKMSRQRMHKEFNQYVREKCINGSKNHSKIIFDENIKTLLKLDNNTDLNHFNVGHYLSPHYTVLMENVDV
jgi:hypothetical protein